MSEQTYSFPQARAWVLDTYFLEHRAKLIDIAAFLDRVERAPPEGDAPEDFRLAAFQQALAVLADGEGLRAKRVLDLFSDPTAAPLEKAPGKGACGAWPGEGGTGVKDS